MFIPLDVVEWQMNAHHVSLKTEIIEFSSFSVSALFFRGFQNVSLELQKGNNRDVEGMLERQEIRSSTPEISRLSNHVHLPQSRTRGFGFQRDPEELPTPNPSYQGSCTDGYAR